MEPPRLVYQMVQRRQRAWTARPVRAGFRAVGAALRGGVCAEALRRGAAALGLGLLITAVGLLILIAGPRAVRAAEPAAAGASGLPLPRFVSLKSDRVHMRRGPGRDHAVAWIFTRGGLPVEVVAEFDTWRRIRDSDGDEGWVFHSLLSGKRTAIVAPWSKAASLDLYAKPDKASGVVARLEPKVLARAEKCDGSWCRVSGQGFSGWLPQENLWGVYPKERLE